MTSALYVDASGPYFQLLSDCWDIRRDARNFSGVGPVVAHPPCERWGRYWGGGPSARVKRIKGDDGGCFASALSFVKKCGGVLEHPEASHAFAHHGLAKPPKKGGWVPSCGGWVCCVEQGHYGHAARKATWLYFAGPSQPFELIWGPSTGGRMDEGFHSSQERTLARANGVKPLKRLNRNQRVCTPVLFAKTLIKLAELNL